MCPNRPETVQPLNHHQLQAQGMMAISIHHRHPDAFWERQATFASSMLWNQLSVSRRSRTSRWQEFPSLEWTVTSRMHLISWGRHSSKPAVYRKGPPQTTTWIYIFPRSILLTPSSMSQTSENSTSHSGNLTRWRTFADRGFLYCVSPLRVVSNFHLHSPSTFMRLAARTGDSLKNSSRHWRFSLLAGDQALY